MRGQQTCRWPPQKKMCCSTETTPWGWRSSLGAPASSHWRVLTVLLLAVSVLKLSKKNISNFCTWFYAGLHVCSVRPPCSPPACNQDRTREHEQRRDRRQWHKPGIGKHFWTSIRTGICCVILDICYILQDVHCRSTRERPGSSCATSVGRSAEVRFRCQSLVAMIKTNNVSSCVFVTFTGAGRWLTGPLLSLPQEGDWEPRPGDGLQSA